MDETWKWAIANEGVYEQLHELNLLSDEHDAAWLEGAAWMAGGMAVCAFLQDLAQLCSPAPPAPQADEVKNMLRQIDAFSCSMRRSWGGK